MWYHTHSIRKSLQDSSRASSSNKEKVLFQGSNFLLQSTNEESNLRKKSFLVRFEVLPIFFCKHYPSATSEVKMKLLPQSKVLQSSRPTEISFCPKHGDMLPWSYKLFTTLNRFFLKNAIFILGYLPILELQELKIACLALVMTYSSHRY